MHGNEAARGCHAIVRSSCSACSAISPTRAGPRVSSGCNMSCCSRSLLSSPAAVPTAHRVTFCSKCTAADLNAAFGLHWRRAPTTTSIRYILQGLEPQAVEQIFTNTPLVCAAPLPIRRDASSRSTARHSDEASTISPIAKAAQVLHAFDVEAGLVLAHVDIEEKSNEIPAAQQLLGGHNVAASIVTLDAMHCQKNLRGRRTGAGSPHRPTEDNQPSLLQKVETTCASQRPVSNHTSVCTGRSRHETRSADVFSATRSVAATECEVSHQIYRPRHPRGLASRCQDRPLSNTSEVAYYVANSAVSACLAATAIRHHWNVENTLHYTRDVTFQEDQSRIRRNPGVFVRLRSFAYNVLCHGSGQLLQSGQIRRHQHRWFQCPGQLVLQLSI